MLSLIMIGLILYSIGVVFTIICVSIIPWCMDISYSQVNTQLYYFLSCVNQLILIDETCLVTCTDAYNIISYVLYHILIAHALGCEKHMFVYNTVRTVVLHIRTYTYSGTSLWRTHWDQLIRPP